MPRPPPQLSLLQQRRIFADVAVVVKCASPGEPSVRSARAHPWDRRPPPCSRPVRGRLRGVRRRSARAGARSSWPGAARHLAAIDRQNARACGKRGALSRAWRARSWAARAASSRRRRPSPRSFGYSAKISCRASDPVILRVPSVEVSADSRLLETSRPASLLNSRREASRPLPAPLTSLGFKLP
jgi:hypothetical protein